VCLHEVVTAVFHSDEINHCYNYYYYAISQHQIDVAYCYSQSSVVCHRLNWLRVRIHFSINGDVRLWDIRMKESFKVINTSPGLTSIDAHQHAELIAWSVLLCVCGAKQQGHCQKDAT